MRFGVSIVLLLLTTASTVLRVADGFSSPASVTRRVSSRVSTTPLYNFLPPSWDGDNYSGGGFNNGRYGVGGGPGGGSNFKTFLIGAVTGSLTQAPISMFHLLALSSAAKKGEYAQLEFDTYSAALTAGFFAIVFRYCVDRIRQDEFSFGPQRNGSTQTGFAVAGTFTLVRTLARIHVPTYCTAAPLNCGAPLGALDYNLLKQFATNGLESMLLFGITALVIDNSMRRRYGTPPFQPPPPPPYNGNNDYYNRPINSGYQDYGRSNQNYGRNINNRNDQAYGRSDYNSPNGVYDQERDRYY